MDESEVVISIKSVWDPGHGKKCKILNDDKLFLTAGHDGQDLAEETSEVFGDEEDANEEDADEEDADEEDANEEDPE